MDSRLSFLVNSRSQSSLLEEVDFINCRLIDAQNRLNTLSGKSSLKSLPQHNITTFSQATKRSNLSQIGSGRAYGQGITAKTNLNFQLQEQKERQIIQLEQMIQKERRHFQQETLLLQRRLTERQKQLQQCRVAIKKVQQEAKEYDQAALNRQLEQLKILINLEVNKSLRLYQHNSRLTVQVSDLQRTNSVLEVELSQRTLLTENRDKQQQACRALEKEYLSSLEQFDEYRKGLKGHYRDSLALCQLLFHSADILNRLTNTEIPATAVMIKEQINASLHFVGTVKDKIHQLCPGIEQQRVELKSRRDISRRFIGDRKENSDPNLMESVFHKVSLSPRDRLGVDGMQMMAMLLIQAQTIETQYGF